MVVVAHQPTARADLLGENIEFGDRSVVMVRGVEISRIQCLSLGIQADQRGLVVGGGQLAVVNSP